jgi:GTP-binding protein Era
MLNDKGCKTLSDVKKKSAFVAVVGRPSVGKSTLINLFCGGKVSIVSPEPQTTRNRIRGIVNREQGQLVFVDTPGRHTSDKAFNRKLTSASDSVLHDSDIIIYMLDCTRAPGEEELACVNAVLSAPPDVLQNNTIVVLNKTDIKSNEMESALSFLGNKLSCISKEKIFQISCKTQTGTDALLEALYEIAPTGPEYYPGDCYTDQDVKFRIAEIVREKTINNVKEEIPHAIYVEVTDVNLKNDKTLYADVVIHVERESQKGIVVGKGGAKIKDIRLSALKDLHEIFDWNVILNIRVKCTPNWKSKFSVE